MDNKPTTYLQAIDYLKEPKVIERIAQRYRVNMAQGNFLEIYHSTLRGMVKKMKANNLSPNQELTDKEANEFIQIFLFIFLNSYGYSQHLKAKNQMFAMSQDGHVLGMSGTLNEERELWTEEDKTELYKTISQKEYITPLVDAYRKEYPQSDKETFKKVLRMAIDIAMQYLEEEYNPPLNHFELQEFIETVTELTINIGAAPSLFFSVPGEKETKPKIPKDAGEDPFERGAYASVGLNESIDNWSQSKLEQHIKKEAEKLLKKGDYVNKKEVKEMIRKTIVQQYKYLWEKSAFFINQI